MAALGEATETPERLWTAAMRANTADEVAHLALQAHAAQVSPHTTLCSSFLNVSHLLFSHAVVCYISCQSPSVTRPAALLACSTQNRLVPCLYECAVS